MQGTQAGLHALLRFRSLQIQGEKRLIAATGLATARHPSADLALSAVKLALEGSPERRASQILLYLTHDFSAEQINASLKGISRHTSSLAIAGMTASGIFTEKGWELDRAAAAALVLFAQEPLETSENSVARICFSARDHLPGSCEKAQKRVGIIDLKARIWNHGRILPEQEAELELPCELKVTALSHGMKILGTAQSVDTSQAHALLRMGGTTALESLVRVLPPQLKDHPPLHLLQLFRSPEKPPVAVIGSNPADGTLLLSAKIDPGERLSWAIRQPTGSEADMRNTLFEAASLCPSPSFGLMFSSIARGPMHYGDDDRDLRAFTERFPDTPLLGAYGTAQIFPSDEGNHLLRQATITLLY